MLYPSVQPDDVPFAQDFLGDQFLLREGSVVRLSGETGHIEQTGLDLSNFLDSAGRNPEEFLGLGLLRQFESEHGAGALDPGKLLSVYPPLCTNGAPAGVSLRPIPAIERIRFLGDFARQISGLPDGAAFRFKVT